MSRVFNKIGARNEFVRERTVVGAGFSRMMRRISCVNSAGFSTKVTGGTVSSLSRTENELKVEIFGVQVEVEIFLSLSISIKILWELEVQEAGELDRVSKGVRSG